MPWKPVFLSPFGGVTSRGGHRVNKEMKHPLNLRLRGILNSVSIREVQWEALYLHITIARTSGGWVREGEWVPVHRLAGEHSSTLPSVTPMNKQNNKYAASLHPHNYPDHPRLTELGSMSVSGLGSIPIRNIFISDPLRKIVISMYFLNWLN